jgi:hypothetical protein
MPRKARQRYKNRIKDFRLVPARELILNPLNPRNHPDDQKAAMKAVLGEVGWADTLKARETPDGLELIDGEMRQDMDEIVPVLVLDVDEAEAELLLSTMDPIGAMAITARKAYEELVANAPAMGEGLKSMQAAVSDGYLTPLKLPVPARARAGKPAREPAEARMAGCRACGAQVRAFVDSLIEHMVDEHPELLSTFLHEKYEGAP